MKVLFIGDYSNLHTTLARELRRMGHQADVLSDGCVHMKVETDFFLKRGKGILGGVKYLYDLFSFLPKLKGYDVVQLINTNFLQLRPPKIKYFYDRLKEQNGSMFLSLAGNDYNYVKACYDAKIFRFSEVKVGEEAAPGFKEKPEHFYGWMSNQNKFLADYIYSDVNGAMAVLPEYDMAARPILGEKVKFTNLPIDFSELPIVEPSNNNKTKIFIGVRSWGESFKGTKILQNIAKEIGKEMPDKVEVEIVKDLPLNDYLNRMSRSDIVLDQLYAYSPAMNALYGMAMGKVVGTGAQPEYYEYLGNPTERPVFSLSPLDTDIKQRLVELIMNKNMLYSLGQQNKKLVQENNDSKIITQRFVSHWENSIK